MDKQHLINLLNECLEYIESAEETIDSEWGTCRQFNQLKRDGEIPDLYDDIVKAKEDLES